MNVFLTTIVLWLSASFGLPAIPDHPRVEFVPASKIIELRYKDVAGKQLSSPIESTSTEGQPETVAIYDDATRTIYLPDGWTGNTAAESSILVHEMVHHLQNLGKLKFACAQQRDELAFEAQERWLGLFGKNLSREFGLDSMSILVKSKCFY